MIVGMTHDEGSLVPNMVVKLRGKISTGYMPNEPPNNTNAPKAAGHFRMLKEVTSTKRVGGSGTVVVVKEWVLNQPIQEALEKINNNKTPRRIEIVCLNKTMDEMWDSSLSMFSKSDGLLCKSHGNGTEAKFLTFDNSGNRKWVSREFEGKPGCPFLKCPDYISGACKQHGSLKCFPIIDLTPNPYKLETRSINSVIGMESSLLQLWELLKVAHVVKTREANAKLQFEGFFGLKLFLVHKKIKSGGRDVFITDIGPTPECIAMIMDPIKRGIEYQAKQSNVIAKSDSFSLISGLEQDLVALNDESVALPENEDDIEDGRSAAVEFGADAGKVLSDDGSLSDSVKNTVAILQDQKSDKL